MTVVNEVTPDAKTFDLKATLAGRTYAKQTVPIFLDEETMFRFGKVVDKANHLDKDAELERDTMVLEFADELIWVTVQGVPRHVRKNLDLTMAKDYPMDEKSTPDEMVARNDEFTARYWQLYVVATKGPDGIERVTDRETIDLLIESLPDASFNAIEAAMLELRDGAKSGYENAVMEIGFLSQP